MPAPLSEIAPAALKTRLHQPDPPLVVDVREAWELEFARLDAAVNVPMYDVPDRLDTLPREREIVVMCHRGNRSRAVARFLEQSGYPRVFNLTGGIDAWAESVDPQVPRY